MFKQEPKENFKDAETIIGPSVTVKGHFNSTGNIVIEGNLNGGVKTAGNVYVGDKASVTANIDSKSARIGGEIKGNIKTEEHLQIVSSAVIFGDIECATLSVDSGAVINGKIVMTKNIPQDKKEDKAWQAAEPVK